MKYVRQLKSGRLEYRRPFPKELRAFTGRNELIVSLKARAMSDVGALERYRAANDEYGAMVAAARREATGSYDVIDRPRIAWIVATFEAEFLAADDLARDKGTVDADENDAADSGWTDALEEGDGKVFREMMGDEAVAIAARQGWVFDKTSPGFGALCLELVRARVLANRLRMERDRGHPVPTPSAPEPMSVEEQGSTRGPAVSGESFAAIALAEMERPTFSGGASTKQSWRTAVRYFREAFGDLPPKAVGRRHASELADLLALSPLKRALPAKERDWPIRELVEVYAGKEVERLSWKARSTILGALQAAWNTSQRSGRIDQEAVNPFSRPNLGKAPRKRPNDGLPRELSKAIFSLPIYIDGERPKGGRGEASYWLPLLLLTTGARPEEVAQALVTDVRQDEEGAWWLSISTEGEHPAKGQRTLKSSSAERLAPLPKPLLDLGFADYVAWLKRAGHIALFPALRPKGERREMFASFGTWWSGYLKKHGVELCGLRPSRAFRPTWATIARESGVSREAQQLLMGHAPDASDMNARYGSREPLRREASKLSFAGWGLEQVRRWEAPSQ